MKWVNFRKRFLEKYFPDSAKHALEAEFLTLQQGSKPIQAYIDRFEYLARFYSQGIIEEWRCRKFEGGLRHELRRFLVPLRIREFPVLVEQARTVEELEFGSSRVTRTQKNTSKTKHQKAPYDRSSSPSSGLRCYNCGGPHLRRNCTKVAGSSGASNEHVKCYKCEKMGHYASHFPNKKATGETPSSQKQQRVIADRPRVAGRVFALTSTEATKSGNLILDRCLLFDNNVLVLFDSGATHSFISQECVSRLGLVVQDLGYELAVSTPALGRVLTNLVCTGCSIEVAGHKFKVNLVCLPLEGLDVILGMDWLSDNHVIMDCRLRSVVFPEADG